jgi:DNA polymerase beta
MEYLTLEHCLEFDKNTNINPLTKRSISSDGPTFLSLIEKCHELNKKNQSKRNNPAFISTIKDFKPIILSELEILKKDEISNKNYFKVRAYEKVIHGIKLIDYPILNWEDIKYVEGIGSKIKVKILEILKEGKLYKAEELRLNPKHVILENLMNIYGIGINKAILLYNSGIHSIEELSHKIIENPNLLNKVQHTGLKYYNDFLKRIPREEMNIHEDILRSYTKNTPFHFDIVGSYRRGADSSGDIDVLLTLSNKVVNPIGLFHDLIEKMKEGGYLIDTLAEGAKKYLGVAKIISGLPRRIDLMLTPVKEYPYALVYFTGSKNFNIHIRKIALDKGWSLNEYGLTSVTNKHKIPPIPIHTEEDLLLFLLGEWIAPENRI